MLAARWDRVLSIAAALGGIACSRPSPTPAATTATSPGSRTATASRASSATSNHPAPDSSTGAPERTGNVADLASLQLEPARRRIVTVTTALKPGGPSEVIDLAEKKSGVELSVRRLHHDDRVESATATMDKKALDELWALVEAERLQSAHPPEADPNVMDGAGHILVLEWPDATGRAHVHALHWSNPNTTHAGVDRLFEKMAALARRSAPSVKLHYFP